MEDVRRKKIDKAKGLIKSGAYERPHNLDAILDIVAGRILLVLSSTQGEND